MYRSDGRVQDLSVDPDELLRAQKASAKKRLLVLGGLAVVLVAGGATTALVLTSRAKKDIAIAHDRFVTCLVGDAASGPPSVRFRAAQLASMSAAPEKRVDDAWPQRCAPRAHAFNEALKANGGSTALADDVEKLAKILGTADATSIDLSIPIEKIFATAKAEALTAMIAADVAPPPAATSPMSLATLAPESRMFGVSLTLSSVYPAPFAEPTLRFVVDDKDFSKGPAVCAFAPGAKEIACSKVGGAAAELSPGLRLWGTTAEGAKPHLFVGDRGKAGVFRSDTGARVIDKLEYGAYGAAVNADGSVTYLAWNEKPPGTHAFVKRADGTTRETLLVDRRESGNPYYATNAFWDFVAYKSVKKGSNGIRLLVRDVLSTGELGPVVDVGRLDEVGHIDGGSQEEPHLTACRAGETTVLRAKGWNNTYLTFRTKQGWSPPVEAEGLAGRLQCREGEASLVQVFGGRGSSARFQGGVNVTRCTVSGCNSEELNLQKAIGDVEDVLPRERKDVQAVGIDGKLLVVWSAGDRGGLRMRLAPMDQIASSPERIVYDDHLRDGTYRPESTLVGFSLHPVPKGALLLLGTVEGVNAYFVDETGKLTPVPTRL